MGRPSDSHPAVIETIRQAGGWIAAHHGLAGTADQIRRLAKAVLIG